MKGSPTTALQSLLKWVFRDSCGSPGTTEPEPDGVEVKKEAVSEPGEPGYARHDPDAARFLGRSPSAGSGAAFGPLALPPGTHTEAGSAT
jgi:hypothetical protein